MKMLTSLPFVGLGLFLCWTSTLAFGHDDATTTSSSSSIRSIPPPFRIPYSTLLQKDIDMTTQILLSDALTKYGIVSVTDWPAEAQEAHRILLPTQSACIQSLPATEKDVQTLLDGTVRQTIATQTTTTTSSSFHRSSTAACVHFDAAAMVMRRVTHDAITAMAHHLSRIIVTTTTTAKPLLVSASKKIKNMETVSDIVQQGVLLEHYHSYVVPPPPSSTTNTNTTTTTIPLHTDQGLFLAFTPGRWATTGALTRGFYVALPDNALVEMEFTDDDQLVFLLGDGVHQCHLDAHLPPQQHPLRAVPHALQLLPPSNNEEVDHHRVWYGVMVLPPSDAILPGHPNMTFGQVRQGLVAPDDSDHDHVHLACSSSSSSSNTLAAATERRLEGASTTGCSNADEIYCWHRCMNATAYDVSVEQCEETFQTLSCINPRDQLWSGVLHGDYFPGCVDADTATNETEFPPLPDSPRNDVCRANFRTKFQNDDAAAAAGTYQNHIDLEHGDGAIFQYTVTNGDSVTGRLIFNGIFGFLAVGLAGDATTSGNVMSHGRVLVATRGDDFSARTGLDLSLPNAVHEYIIDPVATSFRVWGASPYSADAMESSTRNVDGGRRRRRRQLQEFAVVTDECYTILTFTTDKIADRALNLKGSDTFMWAANNEDYFMQYHGSNRGTFVVDWTAVPTIAMDTTSAGVVVVMRHSAFGIVTMMIVMITLSIVY